MVTGGGFPEEFVSILCMRNASLSKNEQSLALASIQGALALTAAAEQMRHHFESCGSAARRDVLVAAAADASSAEESDHAAS